MEVNSRFEPDSDTGGGGWAAGRVTALHADGSLDVVHNDGEVRSHVAMENVRAPGEGKTSTLDQCPLSPAVGIGGSAQLLASNSDTSDSE